MDQRNESEHFKRVDVADCWGSTSGNLDIFRPRDNRLDDVGRLPPPDEIAIQIVENLMAALKAFQPVADELAALVDSATRTQKKPPALGALAASSKRTKWWSWRELNPRPQAFFEQIYMFSGLI